MDICNQMILWGGLIGFLTGALAAGILSVSAIAGHRSAVNTLEKAIDVTLKTQSRSKALAKANKTDSENFTDEELNAFARKRI